jgi:hypothetical protein
MTGLSYEQLQIWNSDEALHKMVFSESATNPGNQESLVSHILGQEEVE